jgi:SAM-dependent methyltransferase/thioredoxin reductase
MSGAESTVRANGTCGGAAPGERPEGRSLPVAIVGAGPVGLAAAAHLVARGETPVVLEAGAAVGEHVRAWGHVQVFSPWRYNVDPIARRMLLASGWVEPDPDVLPTGAELVAQYLEPLAALPALAPHIRLGAPVVAVTRAGLDKLKTAGREAAPFELRVRTADGAETTVHARAVIDASGTYGTPNPLGASGVPAAGEAATRDRIVYGIPDPLGVDRRRYAGRRVLVVGSGHSAFNTLLDLAALAGREPGTTITWAVRRAEVGQMYGGGEADALPARGSLGARLRALVQEGRIRLVTGVRIARLATGPDGVTVADETGRALGPFDRIVATTGFRPDLAMLGELRLGLDPVVESPSALAPLIDPNVHSCGTVPPHGVEELRHPETDFYVVGMKSYGRAPTFLMLTGYEQVRSVVAALTGDLDAARRVELALPQTGVCSATPAGEAATACCGTAAESAEPALGAASAGATTTSACCGAAAPRQPEPLAVGAAPSAGACCGAAAETGQQAAPVEAASGTPSPCCDAGAGAATAADAGTAPAGAGSPGTPAASAGCCAPAPPVVTTLAALPRRDTAGTSIKEVVKARYGAAALRASTGGSACCGSAPADGRRDPITADLYGPETAGLPPEALAASLGCGNPTALAELRPGEVVLDLGSGGGIDVLLSARRVGPAGKAYGLDMTDAMLALARENQRRAGVDNVEFLRGEIEAIPLPDASVDVIISNCVINLSADKDAVLREAFRVLRPGGRLAVSDVVVRGEVPAALRRNVELWIGCVAGALEASDYHARLEKAGFEAIDLEPTRVYRAEDARGFLQAAGGDVDAIAAAVDGKFMSAFIRARKPA